MGKCAEFMGSTLRLVRAPRSRAAHFIRRLLRFVGAWWRFVGRLLRFVEQGVVSE